MNPLLYTRGGTASTAGVRASIALVPLEDTQGRIGAKITGNNMPVREPIFWEVHGAGERGIYFWRPLPAQKAYAIQAAMREQSKGKAAPGCSELLTALNKADANKFNIDDVRTLVGSLWPKSDGEPRSATSNDVKKKTSELLGELVEQGELKKDKVGRKQYWMLPDERD